MGFCAITTQPLDPESRLINLDSRFRGNDGLIRHAPPLGRGTTKDENGFD
jgi:hypothetical protein